VLRRAPRFSFLLLIVSPSLPLIIVLLGFGFMVTFSSILVSSLRVPLVVACPFYCSLGIQLGW
jgi:hypothetical protein